MFRAERDAGRRTVAYARVSGHDQKDDRARQNQLVALHCARPGWTFEVTADPGSGMNYRKKGWRHLLDDGVEGRIGQPAPRRPRRRATRAAPPWPLARATPDARGRSYAR